MDLFAPAIPGGYGDFVDIYVSNEHAGRDFAITGVGGVADEVADSSVNAHVWSLCDDFCAGAYWRQAPRLES